MICFVTTDTKLYVFFLNSIVRLIRHNDWHSNTKVGKFVFFYFTFFNTVWMEHFYYSFIYFFRDLHARSLLYIFSLHFHKNEKFLTTNIYHFWGRKFLWLKPPYQLPPFEIPWGVSKAIIWKPGQSRYV